MVTSPRVRLAIKASTLSTPPRVAVAMTPALRAPFLLAWVMAVSSFALQCQGAAKPNKHWRGLGPINDKYDWLRPPDRVLEAAIAQTYEGQIQGESFLYEYKKTIWADPLNHIYGLWLESPVAIAAMAGQTARSKFEPRPRADSVRDARGFVTVNVLVQSYAADDFPKIAINYRGRTILPSFEQWLNRKLTSCDGFDGVSCWWTGKLLVFEFSDGTRLTGPGELLIRWNSFERTVPLDFDYIW